MPDFDDHRAHAARLLLDTSLGARLIHYQSVDADRPRQIPARVKADDGYNATEGGDAGEQNALKILVGRDNLSDVPGVESPRIGDLAATDDAPEEFYSFSGSIERKTPYHHTLVFTREVVKSKRAAQ